MDDADWQRLIPDETPSLVAGVPVHLIEGLRAYAVYHEEPGNFLRAVLENNFIEAVCRADEESLAGIRGVALYVYNALSAKCWGGRDKVKVWLAAKPVTANEEE